jgi:hypothetical protein
MKYLTRKGYLITARVLDNPQVHLVVFISPKKGL